MLALPFATRTFPALLSVLALSPSPVDDLIPGKAEKVLVKSASDVAKIGDETLFEDLLAVMRSAGLEDKDIEKAEASGRKALSRAKSPAKQRVRDAAAKRVEAAAAAIAGFIETEDCSTPDETAELALALDDMCAAAHEVLGHEKVDGRYFDPRMALVTKRNSAIEEAIRGARDLEVEVEHRSPSTSKIVLALYGDESHMVSSHGVEVHGGVAPERLERALRETLRAAAYSSWVRGGKLAVPKFRPTAKIFFCAEADDYEVALDHALALKQITSDARERQRGSTFGGCQTSRDVYIHRWEAEARISAVTLWLCMSQELPREIQPSAFVGHLNYLCLRFFGTSKPAVGWMETSDKEARTTTDFTQKDEALWRAASSGLFGARAYLRRKIERGERMSISTTLLDHEGKLEPLEVLIATVIYEYMEAADLFKAVAKAKAKKDESRVDLMERVVEATLPDFDALWTDWLMEGGPKRGIAQRARKGRSSATKPDSSPESKAGLKYLTKIREGAFEPLNVWTETTELYDELSVNAKKHAVYLNAHPDQKQAWPDAHEEYPDREGFSAEGAWAGTHSVIAFSGDIESSIDDWLATFYHRLPLLDPGLCGIGVGIDDDVVVLDTGSLVNFFPGQAMVAWPHNGQSGVPRRFAPELPNPVPGEDQTEWGYPVTIQAYWGPDDLSQKSIDMKLFKGDTEVDCHYITPTTARFKKLAPANAYCLIPRAHLDGGATYRVEATIVESNETWSWEFKTGS